MNGKLLVFAVKPTVKLALEGPERSVNVRRWRTTEQTHEILLCYRKICWRIKPAGRLPRRKVQDTYNFATLQDKSSLFSHKLQFSLAFALFLVDCSHLLQSCPVVLFVKKNACDFSTSKQLAFHTLCIALPNWQTTIAANCYAVAN